MVNSLLALARKKKRVIAAPRRESRTNVGTNERAISVAGGLALAAFGLARGGAFTKILTLLAGASLVYRGASGHCPVSEAVSSLTAAPGIQVERAITIQRPARDLYRFWRELATLPQVFSHVKSVVVSDSTHSWWTVDGPVGPVSWAAEIVADRVDQDIAWRSLPGSLIENAGSVHFEEGPAGRGTEVTVSLRYDPPAGVVGHAVSKLLRSDPGKQIGDDLRRFKALMEAGEIATTKGQPSARRGARS